MFSKSSLLSSLSTGEERLKAGRGHQGLATEGGAASIWIGEQFWEFGKIFFIVAVLGRKNAMVRGHHRFRRRHGLTGEGALEEK